MRENMTVELSRRQQELVLEGLRYIRSSRRFEFREPASGPDERRDTDLRMIADLMTHLDPEAVPATAARV